MTQKKHYIVVAAVIVKKDSDGAERIFCAQRPGPKPGKEADETNRKWEFPGGKIEAGETREAALVREIGEEFGANIIVGDFITTVEHEYRTFRITMHAFYCRLASDCEKLELKEHLAGKWLRRDELPALDWADADRTIVKSL